MEKVVHHEDGSVTVPVRTPEGMSTVTVTVADVQEGNNEMWKWVLGELDSALSEEDDADLRQKVWELNERLKRW